MKLIVGLGNPGKEYDGTRHNIGREVIRALADTWGCKWKLEKKLYAEIARYPQNTHSENVTIVTKSEQRDATLLALPTTFMNDSGRAVKALAASYIRQLAEQATNFLIVHDDLDLPLGTMRFTQGSGAAGQKGVASIIAALGTKNFARLRIGVAGEHRATTDAADYVLKKFSREERTIVAAIKKQATEALQNFTNEPLVRVMNKYN